MKILWSNWKDFYKNPNSTDFATGLVDLRRTHLNDIVSVWNEFDEDIRGTIQWNPANFNVLSIYTQISKAPNIIKIITEDGYEWFFYKRNIGAIVNDDKDSNQTINYELNKWDTYLHKKFFQLNDLNPYVETLNLHSDIIIFYWDLNNIDTSSPLIVNSESEEDIREAFNAVIGSDNTVWKTGDINLYYDIKIDTEAKTFEIIPKSVNDVSYLIWNINALPQKNLYELVENDEVKIVKFSDDFSVNELSGTPPIFHGVDFDSNGASLYCDDLGGGKTQIQYKSNTTTPDDSPIWDSTYGFMGSYKWSDGTIWDLSQKTLIFPKNKVVSSNNIVNTDYNGKAQTLEQTNFVWDYEIGTTPSNPQSILWYKFNILEQKQFGDSNIKDNFQMVRILIGSKTAEELYESNGIIPTDTITLTSYHDSTKTHDIAYSSIDAINFISDNPSSISGYKSIGCKMSALKNITFDSSTSEVNGYCSMGGQYQLYIPIGNKEIALFDASGDWLEPSISSISPTPQKVQIAPFASGSKLTDATLDDIPSGLLFALASQQFSNAKFGFANLGDGAWSGGSSEIYDWNDDYSITYLQIPTNKAIKVRISGLSEENSLENKIKTIINNICFGIYDENTEPLFLNPKYFYEAIVYDNSNYIKIDSSWINYEINANELNADGLVLVANFVMNNNFNIFYSFDKNSEDSKIGNNELNTLWNNAKTNLWVLNNKTTMEFGNNAENLANSGALTTYMGYQNYKTKLEQQTMNYDLNQTSNIFNGIMGIGSDIGKMVGGNFAKGFNGFISDVFNGGMKLYQNAQNFKMDILQQNRNYDAQISQIKSANAVNVSAPFATAYGEEIGLFTRYAYEIQSWNKKSKFKEINKYGYFYKDIIPFQRWDNRVYWNALKISSSTNYKYIAQQLQNNDNFGSYEYCEELLLWLLGGVRIWNISQMNDESKFQNLPKILPPYINQKIDWTKFFYWDNLSNIGLIGDDSMNWDVDGDLRKRVIIALQQNQTPDIPEDLIADMNTSNFEFNYNNGNLIIRCLSSDIKYLPTFKEIGNIFVANKTQYYSSIGSFIIINQYSNLKEYYEQHIQQQLNGLTKDNGKWESLDYTYSDENTLHILIKNTFINENVIEYTIITSDTQSIGKIPSLDNSKNNSVNWVKSSDSSSNLTLSMDELGTPTKNSYIFIGGGGTEDFRAFAIASCGNLLMFQLDFVNLIKNINGENSVYFNGEYFFRAYDKSNSSIFVVDDIMDSSTYNSMGNYNVYWNGDDTNGTITLENDAIKDSLNFKIVSNDGNVIVSWVYVSANNCECDMSINIDYDNITFYNRVYVPNRSFNWSSIGTTTFNNNLALSNGTNKYPIIFQ